MATAAVRHMARIIFSVFLLSLIFFVHNPCSSASSVFKAYDFFPAFYSLQDRISSFYYSITDTTCL